LATQGRRELDDFRRDIVADVACDVDDDAHAAACIHEWRRKHRIARRLRVAHDPITRVAGKRVHRIAELARVGVDGRRRRRDPHTRGVGIARDDRQDVRTRQHARSVVRRRRCVVE
jgi:hypothetical protein